MRQDRGNEVDEFTANNRIVVLHVCLIQTFLVFESLEEKLNSPAGVVDLVDSRKRQILVRLENNGTELASLFPILLLVESLAVQNATRQAFFF